MTLAKQSLGLMIACLMALLLLVTAQASTVHYQDPAPLLSWQAWRLIGTCGGVDYLAAFSTDDGRNDFELKIKIDNKNSYAIQTRLNAVIHSENGEHKHRDNVAIGRLNGRRTAEACITTPGLCFGVLFPSAVFQNQPMRIAKLVLTNVQVANIDAASANASLAAYLDPYRDYPHTNCRDLTIAFPSNTKPRFISLTDGCVNGLPKWTKPDCDDAVDEILKVFRETTSPKHQDCIRQWRDYQKCYEVYAFESNPLPRPSCKRPECSLQQ